MVETPDLGDARSNESNVDDVKHSDDAKYLNNFNEFVNQLKIILFEISELTDYANLTWAQNFSFMINLGLFCFFSMKIT